MSRSRTLADFGGAFLLACLIATMVFAYLVLRPFFTIFLVALVLSIVAFPVYRWLVKKTRNRENLSALCTCVLVVVVVVVPCVLLLSLIGQESFQFYGAINEKVQSGFLDRVVEKALELQQRFLPQVELATMDIGQSLTGVAGKVSKFVIDLSTRALKTITSGVWKFLLMLFALFYFLRDGGRFLHWLLHLVPLSKTLEQEIVDNFRSVSESAFYGTFLTAVAQGFLGGLGFFIAGLPPLIWGVVMAFFSLIPVVGTAIIWGPAALLLLLSHKIGSGLFLVFWGVVVVGMSDNILRPMLMRGKNELHPLLIFFSLLGGLSAFGFLGILLGPLAIVLVISLLKAYEEAARPILNEMDEK